MAFTAKCRLAAVLVALLGSVSQAQTANDPAFLVQWYDRDPASPYVGFEILSQEVGTAKNMNLYPLATGSGWNYAFNDTLPDFLLQRSPGYFALAAFGECTFNETRSYNFRMGCDDGCRFLVDGVQKSGPYLWIPSGVVYDEFLVPITAGTPIQIEMHYYERTGFAGLTLEVEVGGAWVPLDGTVCTPGSPPLKVPFAGSSYRAMDGTLYSETTETCQGTGIAGAYLEMGLDLATEGPDTLALMTHYTFGAACMIVRSAADPAQYVALKTRPHNATDLYCDLTGAGIVVDQGTYWVSTDPDCKFRFLLSKSGIDGVEDHAYANKNPNDVNSIFFEQAAFASIDGSDPTAASGAGNCLANRQYKLPTGWQIATNDDLSKASVIGSAHNFGVSCLFLEGNALIDSQTAGACAIPATANYDVVNGYYSVDTCDVGIYIKNAALTRSDADISWIENWGSTDPVLNVHMLESSGNVYGSILGNAPTDSQTDNCQDKAIRIPDGYSLVNEGDAGAIAVAGVARFGTSCLAFSNGNGIIPISGAPCNPGLVSQSYNGGAYHAVLNCNAAVLFTADATPAATDKCGTCIVWGDPHYSTYDGKVYDFLGTGEYWISYARDDDHPVHFDVSWHVRGLQEKMAEGSKLSTVALKYSTDFITIDVDRGTTPMLPIVTVNGVVQSISDGQTMTVPNSATTIARSGSTMIGSRNERILYTVAMPCGVEVRIRGNYRTLNLLEVEVDLPIRYGPHAYGLCGSCDDDLTDEFQTPDCGTEPIDSSQTDIYNNFGERYKLENTNTEPASACNPPTDTRATTGGNDPVANPDPDFCASASREVRLMAEDSCASLSGQTYESCMHDVCKTQNPDAANDSIDVDNEKKALILGPSATCAPVPITMETTSFHGMTYALLDNADPNGIGSGCQTDLLQVPDGWRIAPDTPLHRAALSCYTWDTDCVLFASGTSYTPQLDKCRDNDLATGGVQSECHKPATCNTRILLLKLPDADAIVNNRDFVVDPSDSNLAANWEPVIEGSTTYTRSTESVHSNPDDGSLYVNAVDDAQVLGAVSRIDPQSTGTADNFGRGFRIGAWAKGVNVVAGASAMDADFSLYLDIYFTDATSSLGQYYAPFTGTGDWEYKSVNVILDPSKTVDHINVYLLFREHSGEAYFSKVDVNVLDDDVFNLLKQGHLDLGTNEWYNLDVAEPVQMQSTGSDGYMTVDRTAAATEVGTSGGSQGVTIANGNLNQAFIYENDVNMNSLFFSGESTASSFVPSPDQVGSFYSLYLDLEYTDTSTTYGIFEPFDSTAVPTQTVNRVYKPDSTAVSSVSFNALVRNLRGKAVYDNLFMTTTCDKAATANPDGGFTFGDPHIRSLDATSKDKRGHYDIHAIGEFVLFHDKYVEVQTRHSEASEASVNSAFHVQTPAVDIQIDRSEGTNDPVLRINGKKALVLRGSTQSFNYISGDVQSTTKLLIRGEVGVTTSMAFSLDIKTKVGSEIYAHRIIMTVHLADGGQQFLQSFVIPPDQFRGMTSGFLGDFDGNPDNDWKVPYQVEPVETVEEFAEAWRLTAEESAFLYDDLVDGSQFTNLEFKPKTISSYPEYERSEARKLCKQVGVVDAVLDQCIFDVLVGGESYGKSGYAPIVAMQTGDKPLTSLVGDPRTEVFSGAATLAPTAVAAIFMFLFAALM